MFDHAVRGVKAHHIQDSAGLRMRSSRFQISGSMQKRVPQGHATDGTSPKTCQNRVSWLLELGRDRPLPLVPQAGEQTRMPPLRAVIMNSDTQRLLLSDQHHQFFAPCDAREVGSTTPIVTMSTERNRANLLPSCSDLQLPSPEILE